jgi:hypothetical protein
MQYIWKDIWTFDAMRVSAHLVDHKGQQNSWARKTPLLKGPRQISLRMLHHSQECVTIRIISLAWDTHKLVKNQQYNLWNNATIDLKHERGKMERTYKEGWNSGFRV